MGNSSEYMKTFFTIPENRDKRRQASNRYYQANKHKKKAKDEVYRALLSGKLIKPHTCQCCASTDLEAHHNDYAKPLEVVWLCSRHHSTYHKLLRFMAREEIDRETLRLIL